MSLTFAQTIALIGLIIAVVGIISVIAADYFKNRKAYIFFSAIEMIGLIVVLSSAVLRYQENQIAKQESMAQYNTYYGQETVSQID